MTTITIDRAVLLRALEALRPATAPNGAKRDAAFEELRAALAAPATAPAQPERKPTTDAQCIELFHKVQRGMGFKDHDVIPFISGVAAGEHFHGIKETP